MSNIGKQADFLHGIPVVANSAERDALFPTPDTRQRVHNLTTGYIERWDGANWNADIPTLRGGPSFNVLAYGAKGDGSADDSGAFQAAHDAAKAAGGGVVFAPRCSAGYKIGTCLNFANHGDIPIALVGEGQTQTGTATKLIGNTGGFVIDTMGSQYVTFEHFLIYADNLQSNPSKFGIVKGRTATNQFAQFHHYTDVMVFLPTIPAASSRGTIGIYNVGAEHTLYDQVRCIADAPFVMAATDVLTLPGPFGGTHSGPASMTLCDLNQTTATSWTSYAYEFFDAENIDLRHVYAARASGSATWAFNFNGNCHGFRITGQVEDFPALMNINNDAKGFGIDVMIVAPTASLIALATNVDLETFTIRIRQDNGTTQGLFNAGAATTLKASTVYLETSQFINAASLSIKGSQILAKAMGAPIVAAADSTYLLLADNADATFVGDVQAGGGFRQTIDGWYQENVAASQTNVSLTRLATTTENPTVWYAVRAGSVTGIAVSANASRSAGTLTAKVFKNGVALGTMTAVLDGTNPFFKATTQAKDTDTFTFGDKLDIRVTTDGSWAPTTADVRASLEVET